MIFAQKFNQSKDWATIENPNSNYEKGLWGEQIISEILTLLRIPHKHNELTSVDEYYRTSNHPGPDIFDGDFFQIEVKYYPNSWLCEEDYDDKVKSRFNPSTRLKICIVIEGSIPKNVISKFKEDNIVLIHILDKSLIPTLKTLLTYYFTVYGYWNRFALFTQCICLSSDDIDLDNNDVVFCQFSAFLSQIKGEPPPEIDLLGDEMLLNISFGFISIF